MKTRSCLPWLIILFIILIFSLIIVLSYVPLVAGQTFGAPVSYLTTWQRFSYSFQLLLQANDLTQSADPFGTEQLFVIESGELIPSLSARLEQSRLIRDGSVFRVYLIYTGLDTTVQAGNYKLSPALTAIEIAHALQNATPSEVTFYVLAGWRMEEIAASLPTSGLNIAPEDFLAAALMPALNPDLILQGASAEGFLYPTGYTLPRSTTAEQLVSVMLQNFAAELSLDLREGFTRQGLDVYEAVTLASLLEREAIMHEEMPMIASVFLNRLAIGMKLDCDPTVQFALGYNAGQNTWWTNPLSLLDLQVDSPYNTYLYTGLTPGPISNPGLDALQAVAYPAQTPYYYFRARCDGSGLHSFAETITEQMQNACP